MRSDDDDICSNKYSYIYKCARALRTIVNRSKHYHSTYDMYTLTHIWSHMAYEFVCMQNAKKKNIKRRTRKFAHKHVHEKVDYSTIVHTNKRAQSIA